MSEVFIEEPVHDGIGADRTHGRKMTTGEEYEHQFCVILCVVKGLENINDDVEDVERRPGEKEDDTDDDQHSVGLLSSFHLPSSSV